MNAKTSVPNRDATPQRYPFAMRGLHWLRAMMLLGLIALGWFMTALPDAAPMKFMLYPVHKQLGVTVFIQAYDHTDCKILHHNLQGFV